MIWIKLRILRSPGVLLIVAAAACAMAATPALASHAFTTSFGEAGAGNGQFALVPPMGQGGAGSGVAVNLATGDIYVADTGNHRVEEFSAAGVFIRAFGVFENPAFVAIDNSGGSSQGDVYVGDTAGQGTVSKLDSEGNPVAGWGAGGHLTGFGTGDFGLAGIAVDKSGDLWVYGNTRMHEYSAETGLQLTEWESHYGVRPYGIAVDGDGDLYVIRGNPIIEKFSSSGTDLGEVPGSEPTTGLAVDPATDDLYIDHGAEIVHLDSSGTHLESVSGEFAAGAGLAVGSQHSLFVTDTAHQRIDIFREHGATTTAASEIAATTATLNGEVDPEGSELAECFFEYGKTTDYDLHGPCKESPAQIGTGTDLVQVHVQLEGLDPGTKYHFRLLSRHEGGAAVLGFDRTFLTAGPGIDFTVASAVTATTASLNAQVRPDGEPTTYHFAYLSKAEFNADGQAFGNGTKSTAESESIGEDFAGHFVSAEITGLDSDTAYIFRTVAQNSAKTVAGPPETFYTASPTGCLNEQLREETTSLDLPDCRGYEQVSRDDNAGVYLMETPGGIIRKEGLPNAWYPMQASEDGDSVTYVGEPASSGLGEGTGNSGAGEGDEQLANRSSATGWTSADIQPTGSSEASYFESFSTNLGEGIFVAKSGERHLSPGVETGCGVLYSRGGDPAQFDPLFTTEASICRRPFFVGSSEDGSHRLFESAAKKLEGGQTAPGEGHENVYDSVSGSLFPVNVLPGAQHKVVANATVGSLSDEPELVNGVGVHLPAVNTSNVVSSDGSRIFWTNLATGVVYVRENDTEEPSAESAGHCTEPTKACTVQVSSSAATYETATPDGRYAYYTENGQLWRFDVQEDAREALTPPGAGVQGVIGVNRTGKAGSYVYFVATGALSPSANPRNCQPASEGGTAAEEAEEAQGQAPAGRGCNLYVIHEEATTFIATLLASDNEFEGYEKHQGDWRAALGLRSAQLTPDGGVLTFVSTRRLTSYNNVLAENAECSQDGENHRLSACPEVYIYEVGSGAISCASCDPSGAPPVQLPNGGAEPGTYLPGDFGSITHMRRWVSVDGSRVFFDTVQPLVASDRNEQQDVYEWERAGTGSCQHGSPFNGGGCVFAISDVRSGSFSAFVDADGDGTDIFLVTRSQLIPSDHDRKPDLYDARVNGGFPGSVESTICEGEGCKGPVSATPPPQSPGTATFSEPSPLPLRCKRGFAPKHGRCVSKKRHKTKKEHKKKMRSASADRTASR